MISVEPFNRLVRLAARAFYEDAVPSTSGQQQQHGQAGMAVVVLDALTRRNGQWVREDDLAASLRLQPKSVRRVLRFLEAEMMVATDQRKEPAPKRADSAGAATQDGDEKEKPKLHLHSYCCLDYAQVCDVLRYRLRRMKKKIDDELSADSRDTVQQYVCPGCGRKYSAFDALRLVTEEGFSCEHCGGELVVQAEDKIAAVEDGDDDGDDSKARKRKRREKLNDMRRRMEEQLEPLRAQIKRVEGLPPPDFMSLRSWQKANAAIVTAAAADANSCHPKTEFEVAVLSPDFGGADQSATSADSGFKPFPVWMMRPGMDLTEQQIGGTSGSTSWKVGAKSKFQDDKEEKILQNEYAEADFGRQLGVKCKREDEDLEEEDEIEWEEG
ncbi:unnamed protein product [Alopecurus aequalis]